jgi:hypothetical protein
MVIEVVSHPGADFKGLASSRRKQFGAHVSESLALKGGEGPVVDRGEDRVAGHSRIIQGYRISRASDLRRTSQRETTNVT